MSILRAEELKREWTDRFVNVRKGVAELRRFEGFLGQVRTVNMNGRALVEFGGSADIGWYDIDPQFLIPAEAAAANSTSAMESSDHAGGSVGAAAGAAKVVPPKGPVAKPPATGGTSPLDLIRAQSRGGVSEAGSTITSSIKVKVKVKSESESPGAGAEFSAARGRAIYDAGSPPISATSDPVPSGPIPSPLELLRREGFGSQSTRSIKEGQA